MKTVIDFEIKDSDLVGMIHYKDLSWSEKETELEKYKKNQTVKFKILEINQEKEKIRLGIKQLSAERPPRNFPAPPESVNSFLYKNRIG